MPENNLTEGNPERSGGPPPDQPDARIELITGHIEPHRSFLNRTDGQRRYRATLIEAGDTKNGWQLPATVLGAAINKFTGVPCLLDHMGWFEHPKIDRMAGTIESPVFEDSRAIGDLKIWDTPTGHTLQSVLDAWLADRHAGLDVPDIGLSAILWIKWQPRESWEDPLIAAEIKQVESVDAVFYPAAGGQVERVLNSLGHSPRSPGPPPGPSPDRTTSGPSERSSTMPEEVLTSTQEGSNDTSNNGGSDSNQPSNLDQAQPMPMHEALASMERVAERINELTGQVDRLTAVVAEQEADNVVTGMGVAPRDQLNIRMGRNSIEQIQAATEALITGTRPPAGVDPLTGIRELYLLLSGDRDMTQKFYPDRVYLANVNSATMAGLVANALNKVVVNIFQNYPRWWEPVVQEMDFNTLQDCRWITLGGVGELPTVGEGSSYTELTWDDNTETAAFIKKGGYLGLTIEAIDKDDTRRLQMAPQALAQAAWLTLSKSISSIFTSASGAGPNLADTVALFHSSRGNVGTTALSHAEWTVVRTAMRKFTELNSAERLGALTTPKFLLVPPDLEALALEIMASSHDFAYALSNGVAAPDNIFSEGDSFSARISSARNRVIVIDLWTDATDWAAVADPNLYPSLAIGYRFGRTPEIFSVASPTAGLMFSNDVMPIKIRFFYATGPTDWRGLYKENVAG